MLVSLIFSCSCIYTHTYTLYTYIRTTCDFAFRLTLLDLTTSRNCPGPEPLVFVPWTNPVTVQLKTDGRTSGHRILCVRLFNEQTASTQLNALSWEK